MQAIQLQWIDYTILVAYVAFVLGIGWALARYMKTSADFLTSARSIPTWVTGLAFISANLGALELVGMAGSGAKYGIATAHFYWVGAIPAMVFLAIFMMPFYYGSKARSVPEYLKMRFDERVRALNSVAFAVMTIFTSGISIHALALLLNQLLHWNYHLSLWICSGVVLLYVLKGGLTSAIYTEVLQFFMIVLGFAPVVYLGLKDVGGWHTMNQTLQGVPTKLAELNLAPGNFEPNAWTSAWQPLLAGSASNPMGVDWFAMIFGLGFVLSFGYWCTNFLVVQRAMAAKNMNAARNTPLVASVPKMLFPFLVIVPGMIAVALMAGGTNKDYRLPPPVIAQANYDQAVSIVKNAQPGDIPAAVNAVSAAMIKINRKPAKMDEPRLTALITASLNNQLSNSPAFQNAIKAGQSNDAAVQAAITSGLYNSIAENDYNNVILSLVKRYCPPGLLGLALTALLASFMSGMAGNVTAFNTVFTYDLYQAYFVKNKSDRHYFWTGKVVTVVGILLSIAAAYFARKFDNIMDFVQLVFGFVSAPLFATFLLGMFWKRCTGTGAFVGLLCGIGASAVFHGLTVAEGKGGWLGASLKEYHSSMAQNFWLAAVAFAVCFVATAGISLATKSGKTDEELKGLVYSLTPKIVDHNQPVWQRPAVVGTVLLVVCVILNFLFW